MKDTLRDEKNGVGPPSYDGPPGQDRPPLPVIEDLSQRLNNLDFKGGAASLSPATCIAHLKFLEAVYQLRESVANKDGLFGIATPPDPKLIKPDLKDADAQIRVREKRWAVYVARAVDRFEAWWNTSIPCTTAGSPVPRLTTGAFLLYTKPDQVAVTGTPIMQLNRDQLPPLDVLMVWHSYSLNPRCFLEDAIRYQKLDFYATNFPWQYIDQCIDAVSFEYQPTARAQDRWATTTQRQWDNLHDPIFKTMPCPNGTGTQWKQARPHEIRVPWTTGAGINAAGDFVNGAGYADADFKFICPDCRITLSHDYLRVQKFRDDLILCRSRDYPMAGTILGRTGTPGDDDLKRSKLHPSCSTPNLVVKSPLVYDSLEGVTAPDKDDATMSAVKAMIEGALLDRKALLAAGIPGGRMTPSSRTAIRRMLSRYWYNSSPFALDLVGAVIRQGSFIEKMHNIDWLHSPALDATMARLITKYGRFFKIMTENPRRLAVPTLDVDLAWHTHQLMPQQYYSYSMELMKQFVDHDDKIAEHDLSSAFEWTSKTYAKMFDEAYSQCTCWYCEAVREKTTNVFSRMSKKDELRQPEDGCPSDPMRSAHISAHNAVRSSDDHRTRAQAAVKAAELDRAYHKACARARKKGKPEPQRDEYFYAYAYGYPYMFPMYYPYAVDPCIGYSGAYAAPPCDVNTAAGSYGACAAGTCGGTAAAGGCASAGGGCGGAGGCGGGGGGGGGGGCGGGGGGCGGGGG